LLSKVHYVRINFTIHTLLSKHEDYVSRELRFLSLQSVAFRGHGLSLLGRKPLPVGSQDSCLSRRSQPTYVQGNLNMPDTPERLNNFIYIVRIFNRIIAL